MHMRGTCSSKCHTAGQQARCESFPALNTPAQAPAHIVAGSLLLRALLERASGQVRFQLWLQKLPGILPRLLSQVGLQGGGRAVQGWARVGQVVDGRGSGRAGSKLDLMQLQAHLRLVPVKVGVVLDSEVWHGLITRAG